MSASHGFTDKIEVAVELAGEANAGLHRTVLVANLGAAVELNEHTSLLVSLGRELHNHDEPKASFIGFVGVQWRL